MAKQALSIDDQLSLLKSRGLVVIDELKAKKVLADIGYYRLGFYLFPFEQTYPDLHHRTHLYNADTRFGDAVKLYYFDFELRNLLLKYISRIEVNFRTILTYEGSMVYKPDSHWFVNPACIDSSFIAAFDNVVYNKSFKKNPTIKRHHKKYPRDKYAPAWKTIELMTLGENVTLYSALLDHNVKQRISRRFGIKYVDVFENYIELVRILRNTCAHGSVLFDFKPFKRIKSGPANLQNPAEYMNLHGSIKVVRYLLKQVSANRERDMAEELQKILDKYNSYPVIADILSKCGGLPQTVIERESSLKSEIPGWLRKLLSKIFCCMNKKS